MSPRSDHDELSTRRSTAPDGPGLHLVLAAEMATPSLVRGRLSRWLAAYAWPGGEHDDLVLAVSEAVSNSVEHGYGIDHATARSAGSVELHGVVIVDGGRRHAVLTVTDHGSWLAPSGERGNRRHGIPLMRACAASVTVDGTSHGTTVVLHSRTVPSA